MENIANFTRAIKTYGLSDAETFQTVDLYEKMNLHQVILCIFALGRKVNHIIVFLFVKRKLILFFEKKTNNLGSKKWNTWIRSQRK